MGENRHGRTSSRVRSSSSSSLCFCSNGGKVKDSVGSPVSSSPSPLTLYSCQMKDGGRLTEILVGTYSSFLLLWGTLLCLIYEPWSQIKLCATPPPPPPLRVCSVKHLTLSALQWKEWKGRLNLAPYTIVNHLCSLSLQNPRMTKWHLFFTSSNTPKGTNTQKSKMHEHYRFKMNG